MKSVIVTGADGFIGSNLIRFLQDKDVRIYAIVYPDSETQSRLDGMKNICIIKSDIPSLKNHIELLPTDADAFYFFSWQGVNALERKDFDVQLGNIDLCMECIRLAAELHAKKFIFPGSTYEYMYCGAAINEKSLPTPQNAYGSVKAALRYIAAEYAKSLSLNFIYVVIAGIYAVDRRDNNVIYYVIDQLLKKECPKLTKLEQLWDYVHIDDVVRALYLVGEKGKDGAFYAIGKGDNQPLYQYIDIIRDYIDPSLPLGIGAVPYSSDTLPMSCIDLTAIRRDTGFEPEIEFRDGIKEIIDKMRAEYEEKADE